MLLSYIKMLPDDRYPFGLEESVKEERHVLKVYPFWKLGADIIKKLLSEYLLAGAYGYVEKEICALMGIEYSVFKP